MAVEGNRQARSPWVAFALAAITTFTPAWAQEPYITYSNGANSERNLPVCADPHQACNVVHDRFWLSPLVVRLCKCADRTECPKHWETNDRNTLFLNARTQLKFCSPVGDLPVCGTKETALETEMRRSVRILLNQTACANCFCPHTNNYFRKISTSIIDNPDHSETKRHRYVCDQLPQCASRSFCGSITVGRYETYPICQCPPGQLCLLVDRRVGYVSQPLYDGLAYSGYCTRKQ